MSRWGSVAFTLLPDGTVDEFWRIEGMKAGLLSTADHNRGERSSWMKTYWNKQKF
jgi:hypothetical protein